MALKYCSEHEIWYDYREGCPECGKIGRVAGNIIGGVLGGALWATVKTGKIIKKIFSDKDEKKDKHRLSYRSKQEVSHAKPVETKSVNIDALKAQLRVEILKELNESKSKKDTANVLYTSENDEYDEIISRIITGEYSSDINTSIQLASKISNDYALRQLYQYHIGQVQRGDKFMEKLCCAIVNNPIASDETMELVSVNSIAVLRCIVKKNTAPSKLKTLARKIIRFSNGNFQKDSEYAYVEELLKNPECPYGLIDTVAANCIATISNNGVALANIFRCSKSEIARQYAIRNASITYEILDAVIAGEYGQQYVSDAKSTRKRKRLFGF